ncbi:MAG: hypothetical protein JWO82_120 [Akkermansiaceae bacterium]|nr:hypothetical protein [Akkermansiaceae bacterium]
MKPPQTPSRFQSNHRHYHRHQSDDPNSWDNWVSGATTRRSKPVRLWKRLGIAAGILAFAGVVALLVYQLR